MRWTTRKRTLQLGSCSRSRNRKASVASLAGTADYARRTRLPRGRRPAGATNRASFVRPAARACLSRSAGQIARARARPLRAPASSPQAGHPALVCALRALAARNSRLCSAWTTCCAARLRARPSLPCWEGAALETQSRARVLTTESAHRPEPARAFKTERACGPVPARAFKTACACRRAR